MTVALVVYLKSGKWYPVTDVYRPHIDKRREGIDSNVYFIEVDGVRTGVHGEHCETNGFNYPSHTAEFFENLRKNKNPEESEDQKEITDNLVKNSDSGKESIYHKLMGQLHFKRTI